MHIVAQLTEDHRLIERVVGALQTYTRARLEGRAEASDLDRFVAFFRRYVGGCHHEREERVLVPALVEHLEVPADRGPIGALLTQHHTLAAELDELARLLAAAPADPSVSGDPTNRSKIEQSARRYTHGLWAHIDAEDSVWFPESEGRLSKQGARALPLAEPVSAQERALREDGERLVAAYPPVPDPTALRGAGCVMCPSYGADCAGLEREWWRPSEWDELDDHLGDHLL